MTPGKPEVIARSGFSPRPSLMPSLVLVTLSQRLHPHSVEVNSPVVRQHVAEHPRRGDCWARPSRLDAPEGPRRRELATCRREGQYVSCSHSKEPHEDEKAQSLFDLAGQ